MSTKAVREQYIQRALANSKENYRVPFKDGLVLEVIEVPLDLPVLNATSFRIAPDLADHPQRDEVLADPESDASQLIIAALVRRAHRQAEALKDSLANNQHQPGVITRSGKLINANTRCVLLRELFQDAKIQNDKLRVAVLPATFQPEDEVQLESVLQQQREYKDEYNFVAELMMLRTLSQEAHLTDAQIALQQERGRHGAREVTLLREILEDMERARRLMDPPLPLSKFVSDEGQKENWKVIHAKVRAQDKLGGAAAGDAILRNFLLATFAGSQAVHKGPRHIHPEWVEADLLPALKAADDPIARELAGHIEQAATNPVPVLPTPSGVDLLGGNTAPEDAPSAALGSAALNLVYAAAADRSTVMKLASGRSVSGEDVVTTVRTAARKAFDDADRREEAGSRLERPVGYLTKARKDLKDAAEAVAAVAGEEEFGAKVAQVSELLAEVSSLVKQLQSLLDDDGAEPDDGAAGA